MDSTASPNDLLQRLSAAIERLGAAQNHQPAPAATGSGQFGLPAAWPAPISPMGPPALGAMPQPAGVSVPVTVPLPDGRELSVRVHFGPEAAANLAATDRRPPPLRRSDGRGRRPDVRPVSPGPRALWRARRLRGLRSGRRLLRARRLSRLRKEVTQ